MRYEKSNGISDALSRGLVTFYPLSVDNDSNLEEVEYLLERGANPNRAIHLPKPTTARFSETKGYSYLIAAVRAGSRKLCELLISYGARPDISDISGTPLSMAIFVKNYYMIEKLLEYKQNFNVISKFQGKSRDEWNTPLGMAACRGLYKVANLLLKKGADPDYPVLGVKITDHITNKRMIRLLNSYTKEKQDEKSERGEQSEDEDIAFDYEPEPTVWDPPDFDMDISNSDSDD